SCFELDADHRYFHFSLHDALPIYRLLRRCDDGLTACVTLAALDDEDVIAHIDSERRVVAADPEHAVTKLVDWRSRIRGHLRSGRSEEHTSELQSQSNLVCRLPLEK